MFHRLVAYDELDRLEGQVIFLLSDNKRVVAKASLNGPRRVERVVRYSNKTKIDAEDSSGKRADFWVAPTDYERDEDDDDLSLPYVLLENYRYVLVTWKEIEIGQVHLRGLTVSMFSCTKPCRAPLIQKADVHSLGMRQLVVSDASVTPATVILRPSLVEINASDWACKTTKWLPYISTDQYIKAYGWQPTAVPPRPVEKEMIGTGVKTSKHPMAITINDIVGNKEIDKLEDSVFGMGTTKEKNMSELFERLARIFMEGTKIHASADVAAELVKVIKDQLKENYPKFLSDTPLGRAIAPVLIPLVVFSVASQFEDNPMATKAMRVSEYALLGASRDLVTYANTLTPLFSKIACMAAMIETEDEEEEED